MLKVKGRWCEKLFATICVVLWKSAVCYERNKDHLDPLSRGFQIETPLPSVTSAMQTVLIGFQLIGWGTLQNTASLSHVSGGAWNATPFCQPKIQSSTGVHSADALVLYGNAIYSIWAILFNDIKSKQNHTWQTLIRGHTIHTAPLFHHIIHSYLLIIDKFPVIRYQATVKQSALIFDNASWPACSQTITIVLFCSKEPRFSSHRWHFAHWSSFFYRKITKNYRINIEWITA